MRRNAFAQVDLSMMDASGPDGICTTSWPIKRKTYNYSSSSNGIVNITASMSTYGSPSVCLLVDGQACAGDSAGSTNQSSSASCNVAISPGSHVFEIILIEKGGPITFLSASVMVIPY